MNFDDLPGLRQAHLDWLVGSGVSTHWLTYDRQDNFSPLRTAMRDGREWIAFHDHADVIYWQPRTGELVSEWNRAFALGESNIHDAATYSFDCALNIFTDPLAWLVNHRDGCVVLDWNRCFDQLRDCPRIAIAYPLLATYRRHMRPPHWPDATIMDGRRAAA